jgi:hypothetical protein
MRTLSCDFQKWQFFLKLTDERFYSKLKRQIGVFCIMKGDFLFDFEVEKSKPFQK